VAKAPAQSNEDTQPNRRGGRSRGGQDRNGQERGGQDRNGQDHGNRDRGGHQGNVVGMGDDTPEFIAKSFQERSNG
jgi:hypothetical protein